MTIVSAPTVWIYGGVHHDPGSRRRFIEELAEQEAAPRFVAVEWEESVFAHFVAWRPWIKEDLRSRWEFLTSEDCYELSLALAWEGDAYMERFPDTDRLWLDTGCQEAYLQQRGRDAHELAKDFAYALLGQLCNPCHPTFHEVMAHIAPPPEPRSKQELIDRVWGKRWSEAFGDEDFERDARWASAICERISDLRNGWIAVVVGWAHADPQRENQRLRGLLSSRGFCVNSVRLGP